MANGNTHRALAALTVGGTLLYQESLENKNTARPLIGTVLGGMFGTLPDLLEPASNPHHRQFFHGAVFLVAVGWVGWKTLEWCPEDDWQKAIRFTLLVGCGAYLSHLALDALSKHSLPLVGKL